MTFDEVMAEFRDAGALLEGHFILSSGLRSPVFLQKMFIFQDPARTEKLCRALADLIVAKFGKIDVVVSPAIGGIVPGYETARHLGAKAVFVSVKRGVFNCAADLQFRKMPRSSLLRTSLQRGFRLVNVLKPFRV